MAKSKRSILWTKIRMLFDVRAMVGDTLLFPYSNEVAAGEPSAHRAFHAKYHDQQCVLRQIRKVESGHLFESRPQTMFKVRFDDGTQQELLASAFVYIGRKKAKKKQAS